MKIASSQHSPKLNGDQLGLATDNDARKPKDNSSAYD